MNNFFKKIYCINLKNRTDRRDRCIDIFKSLGIEVEFVEAVKGEDIYNPSFPICAGYQGLNRTIINIIDKSIDLENFLIFEDDVEFIDGTMKIFDDNVKNIPENWSVLYLGGLNGFATSIVADKIHYVRRCVLGHAVAIKKDIYQEVKAGLGLMQLPSDVVISNAYFNTEKKGYSFIPGIAYQRGGYSDCKKGVVPEKEVN